MDFVAYRRRKSHTINVGNTPMGGGMPIRVQSMTDTPTMDTEASVAQVLRIAQAGGEYVRLTAQGTREAENIGRIRAAVRASGCQVPLVADVLFNPRVADVAALHCEKVRINPGNYADPARRFRAEEYTDEEYALGLRRLEERLVSFLDICRSHHTAVRIGVNHGSLSDRIMSRYGDTPEGIVESCMEFLRICLRHSFADVAVSVKASNTLVMVRSVRLLVEAMEREGMDFPLHLGVTEAGEGEDGRIKSAVGIGALLADGIGDTVRVSLSEPPEREIPVARDIVAHIERTRGSSALPTPQPASAPPAFDWLNPQRRLSAIAPCCGGIGGALPPVALTEPPPGTLTLNPFTLDAKAIEALRANPTTIVLSSPRTPDAIGEHRALAFALMASGLTNPLLLRHDGNDPLQASVELGTLFIDSLADGIVMPDEQLGLSILQAARARFTKTEYISCPGCGRTLYDLQSTLARIKSATKHLRGKTIAVMGCIVNGPGEMAGADYGYVGAARGKVSLYKGRDCIERNIPEAEAVEHLLRLIEQDNKQA